MAVEFRRGYFERDEGFGAKLSDSRQYEVGYVSFSNRKRAVGDGVSMALVAIAALMMSQFVCGEELKYGRLLEPMILVEDTLESKETETEYPAQGWVEVVNGERWIWTGEAWQISD